VSSPLLPALAVDHVGIAALDRDAPLAALLGDPPGDGIVMPSGVTVSRFGPDSRLELVSPARQGSPVENFLARRGPGLHHVAFRVEAPLAELAGRLLAAGVELAGGVEPSSDGRPSVFLHPRSTGGVLVELVQGEA
jgi:methylmalonyl-CoA/ethylmalonyl-CoA epimerase